MRRTHNSPMLPKEAETATPPYPSLSVEGGNMMSLVGRFLHARNLEKSDYDSTTAIDHARKMPEMAMRRRGARAIGMTLLSFASLGYVWHIFSSSAQDARARSEAIIDRAAEQAQSCDSRFQDIREPYSTQFRQICKDSAYGVNAATFVLSAHNPADAPSSTNRTYCDEVKIQPLESPAGHAEQFAKTYGLTGKDVLGLTREIMTSLGMIDEDGKRNGTEAQPGDEYVLCATAWADFTQPN